MLGIMIVVVEKLGCGGACDGDEFGGGCSIGGNCGILMDES